MKKNRHYFGVVMSCLLLFSAPHLMAQKLSLEWATPISGSDSSGMVMTSGITLDKDEDVYSEILSECFKILY